MKKGRGTGGPRAYLLREDMIRTTCAEAWSVGEVPGVIGDLVRFMVIHLTSSFRCYLIGRTDGGVLIAFDAPIPF